MRDAIPYLTIAITNRCNFKCKYCSPDGNGGFGEGFGTTSNEVDVEDLENKIKVAEIAGMKKFFRIRNPCRWSYVRVAHRV